MEPISDAPTIDAVITSYNQKKLILEAVESVLKQTVKPSNIYIIDDVPLILNHLKYYTHLNKSKQSSQFM